MRTTAKIIGILLSFALVFSLCLTAFADDSTINPGDPTNFNDDDFFGERGDLNGDSKVTDQDAIYLLFHTFFPEDYPVYQDCDFNGDGKVTDQDAVYLLFYTFFPDDYPLNGGSTEPEPKPLPDPELPIVPIP